MIREFSDAMYTKLEIRESQKKCGGDVREQRAE